MESLENQPKKRYHHQNLPKALIETALKLLQERGRPDFTMRELAKLNGVTHAAAYKHFSNKAALLDALVAHGYETLALIQEQELAEASPAPKDRLFALSKAFMRFTQNHQSLYTLVFSHSTETSTGQNLTRIASARTFQTLISVVKECQAVDYVIDAAPERIAAYLTLSLHGLAGMKTFSVKPIDVPEDIFPNEVQASALALIAVLKHPPSEEERRKLLTPLSPS